MQIRNFVVTAFIVTLTTVSSYPTEYISQQGLTHDISAISPGYGHQQIEKGSPGQYLEEENYGHEPAEYSFHYSVHDEHTADIKSHQEERKGDVVRGRYEVIDPDGHHRVVEYTVDGHSGFVAIVRRQPTDIKVPVPEHLPYSGSETHGIVAEPSYPSLSGHQSPGSKYLFAPSTQSPITHYTASEDGDYGVDEYTAGRGQLEDSGLSQNYKQ